MKKFTITALWTGDILLLKYLCSMTSFDERNDCHKHLVINYLYFMSCNFNHTM